MNNIKKSNVLVLLVIIVISYFTGFCTTHFLNLDSPRPNTGLNQVPPEAPNIATSTDDSKETKIQAHTPELLESVAKIETLEEEIQALKNASSEFEVKNSIIENHFMEMGTLGRLTLFYGNEFSLSKDAAFLFGIEESDIDKINDLGKITHTHLAELEVKGVSNVEVLSGDNIRLTIQLDQNDIKEIRTTYLKQLSSIVADQKKVEVLSSLFNQKLNPHSLQKNIIIENSGSDNIRYPVMHVTLTDESGMALSESTFSGNVPEEYQHLLEFDPDSNP